MKYPYFRLSWHLDRSGKHPQPILRAFLRGVLAEVWWKRHIRHLRRKTIIYDKFRALRDDRIKGKYATIKLECDLQQVTPKEINKAIKNKEIEIT